MDFKTLSKNKHIPILAFKISEDILKLFLLAFFLFLIAESALPGFISSQVSFLELILAILAVLWLTIFLGRKNDFQFGTPDKKNRWVVEMGIIIFFTLIANSLFKFSLWEILIIAPLSCFVLIYFYKVFSDF